MTDEKNDDLLREQGAWTTVERELHFANDSDANEESVIHNTSPSDDGEATEVEDDGD